MNAAECRRIADMNDQNANHTDGADLERVIRHGVDGFASVGGDMYQIQVYDTNRKLWPLSPTPERWGEISAALARDGFRVTTYTRTTPDGHTRAYADVEW